MNHKLKAFFTLLLICIGNSIALEQYKPYKKAEPHKKGWESITATGGASGVVASDDITINCQIYAEAFSAKRAEIKFYKQFDFLQEDLKKLGVSKVKSSDFSVKKTGQKGEKDLYTASAKLEIYADSLTESTQVSKRLEKLSYIRNQYALYSYSKEKINKKIEELLDSAILKAEEKAVEEAEQSGKYITRVIDSDITVDAEARFLKYASEEERQRFRGKKGYKFINLSVSIVYGVEEFEEYQRSFRAGPRGRGAKAAVYEGSKKAEGYKVQKESVSKFRSGVRSKLLASAIRN